MEKILNFSCAAKPKIFGVVLFCIIATVAVDSKAITPNTYPYSTNFDGIASGTHLNDEGGWYSVVSNTALVTNSPSHSGNNSLYIKPLALVSNFFDGKRSTNLWINFWTKPSVRADPAAPSFDTACSGQFYFNLSNNAVAYDHNIGWRVLANNAAGFPAAKINPTNFNRVTVFLCHANGTWALMVNDELLADGMKMAYAYTGLNSFAISNSAYMDTITVETNTPSHNPEVATDLNSDIDVDGMPDVWELSYFRNISSQGWSSDYDGDGRTSLEEYQEISDPTNALSFKWRLPYLQTFEQAPVGVLTNWRAIRGSGDVRVQTAVALQGARSASIVTGQLTLAISDASATNVWIHVLCKPNVMNYIPLAPPATVAGAFCVVSNAGALYAYSENVWQKMDIITNVPVNQLLGFAVHIDYTNRLWNLYVSTNNVYGPLLTLANGAVMRINTNYASSYFTGFAVTNDTNNSVYVDMMAASHAFTNVSAAHTNVYAAERFGNSTYTVRKPPYDYVGTNSTLGYQLGIDLARSLYNGDEVSVLSTNGWNEYYINGGAWLERVNSMPATNLYIYETTGISMHRVGASDLMVFYPYATNNYATNVIVYCTTEATNGWNLLVWPGLAPRGVNTAPGIGFNPLDTDLIFVYQNYRYRQLYRRSGKWYEGGSESTLTLSPNQGFWYRNTASTNIWWTVDDVTP